MERMLGCGHYAGDLRLSEKEFACSYDTPKIRREALESGFDHPIFFIEHCNDLWSGEVPQEWVDGVLKQCCDYPLCEFVFQSKNPERMIHSLEKFPVNCTIGTTCESDIYWKEVYNENELLIPPSPVERLAALKFIGEHCFRTFVTVEPILLMESPVDFARMIADANPSFVNIGADSKGTGLPEPSKQQVLELIDALKTNGVTIRKKSNLERILKDGKATNNG